MSETSGTPSQSVKKLTSGPSPSIEVVEKRTAKRRARNARWHAKRKLLAEGGKKGPNDTTAGK